MTRYYRLSGGGNDFLALVEPPREPSAREIRAWCTRGISAGADGLFLLRRTEAGARMIHYNADGGRAALCLNGARCAARLALELGWGEGEIEIETDAGKLRARGAGDDRATLELAPPGEPRRRELRVEGRAVIAWHLTIGVPHLVVEWPESLEDAPVADLGQLLRHHQSVAPEGANVNFVRYPAPGTLEIRTFERGVEAETLACGTGILAAVAVGVALGRTELPCDAITLGGFPFTVDGRADDARITAWSLTGDTRLVARGELLPGADAQPTPPPWR